jgi:DNA polymerase-4
VERLWGVGAVTGAKLRDRGISTVGQVAALDEAALVSMLGAGPGRHLHALAHNRDPRPVQVGRRRRSIGSQRALGSLSISSAFVDTVVVGLVDRVSSRMRASGRVGRTVVLRLRFDDFGRVTRSHTLPRPTSQTDALLAAVRALVSAAMPMIRARGLTLVGIAVANLEDHGPVQLVLPFDRRSHSALDAAVDEVRDRFGRAAVTRVVLLGQDLGPSVPLLPD